MAAPPATTPSPAANVATAPQSVTTPVLSSVPDVPVPQASVATPVPTTAVGALSAPAVSQSQPAAGAVAAPSASPSAAAVAAAGGGGGPIVNFSGGSGAQIPSGSSSSAVADLIAVVVAALALGFPAVLGFQLVLRMTAEETRPRALPFIGAALAGMLHRASLNRVLSERPLVFWFGLVLLAVVVAAAIVVTAHVV